MNISLSDSFTAATSDTYAAQLKSDRLTVNVTKETLTLLAAAGLDTNMSLKAYAEKFIYSRELVTEIVEESNMTYFSYLTVPAGESDTVTVLAFVFKSADAYWMVQFQTPTATFPVEKANIFNYASSISFK